MGSKTSAKVAAPIDMAALILPKGQKVIDMSQMLAHFTYPAA